MATALVTHPACLEHVNPAGHPEQVARLERILSALDGKELTHVKAPLVAEDDLVLVHPRDYVGAIRDAAPTEGWVQLDGDTFMSPGSLEAAHRAQAVHDLEQAGIVVHRSVLARSTGVWRLY